MSFATLPVKDRRRIAHLGLTAVLLCVGVAAAVFSRFPPSLYGFYPTCPVHAYLHFECPGCGATRALAALLHGHLIEALQFNALFVAMVLPCLIGWGLLTYMRAVGTRDFCWPQLPIPALYAGVAAVAMFTVLRNV